MAAKKINLLFIITVLLPLFTSLPFAAAEESFPFKAEVNNNNINIRSDATVNSEVICSVNKGVYLYVLKESYGWYKVRLPKNAPSFINKNLVSPLEPKPNKVTKENINIRLRPNQSSPIIGKADKDEIITIFSEEGQWYKIEPVENSYGWINKKFVNEAPIDKTVNQPNIVTPSKKNNKETQEGLAIDNLITVQGIIKPQGAFFKTITTHKLISQENKIFFIKADKKYLDNFNHRKVKVSGILTYPIKQKYPVIEIEKVEALN